MSEPTKAVFLSYAREDAEAARRIAEALRAFGVEDTVIGRQDDALACLRELLAGPSLESPNELRIDPYLSR